MTNELNRVVTVALSQEGRSVAHDNMNVIMLITSDNSVLNSNNRWMEVAPSEVAGVFGAYSKVAEWANIVAGTKPNATQVGGKLIIGYHRAAEEVVADQVAKVVGAEVDYPVIASDLVGFSGQTISVETGDTVVETEAITITGSDTLTSVVATLNTASESAGITFSLNGLSIVASSTGASKDFELSGNIAGILGLTLGTGATKHAFVEGGTLEPETRVEALSVLKGEVNFKGAAFIDRLLDSEIQAVAEWANANQTLIYETFNDEKYTTFDNTNPCWKVKMAGLRAFRMLWLNDRRYAAAYMARMHTVNFNGENTAITMHLKELPVVPVPISDDLWSKLNKVGLDPYTTTKDTANVLCSEGNDYVDNEYNLIAFINHVQTDVFNLLKSTFTKLAQTEPDGQVLVDQCEKTSRRFARANFIAPGEWSNPNILGNREAFLRSIRDTGFYWQIGSFADQPQSDRERRIAPLIQGAIKNAGAIHKADILINFNK